MLVDRGSSGLIHSADPKPPEAVHFGWMRQDCRERYAGRSPSPWGGRLGSQRAAEARLARATEVAVRRDHAWDGHIEARRCGPARGFSWCTVDGLLRDNS